MTIKERLDELQESGAATQEAVQAAEEWLSSWMGRLDRGLPRAEETPLVNGTEEKAVLLEWQRGDRRVTVEVWGTDATGGWDIYSRSGERDGGKVRLNLDVRVRSVLDWLELWAWLWMGGTAQTPD